LTSWPTVILKDNEHPWVTFFRQQAIRKNKCINSVMTGMPGTGKSWGLIYLLSQADPDFDIERIYFRAAKMMRWIKEGGLKPKKGIAFMFDEAGIDASNTQWWNEVNRGLNAFFQTSRSSNYIFGMTVPFLTLVSKGVRNLMNVRFYAGGYTDTHTIFNRAFTTEWNDEKDKTYKKRLFVRRKGIDNAFCSQVRLPQAERKLLKEYEKIKEEFKDELLEDIEDNLKAHEIKQQEKKLNGGVLLKRQQQYYDLRWAGQDKKQTCDILSITVSAGNDLQKRIRERGKYFPEDEETTKKTEEIKHKNGITGISPKESTI